MKTKEELGKILKEAKDFEDKGDFFSASFFYKDATEIARVLNDAKMITFCKNKIVETNRKSSYAYKEIGVEQHIPNEEIEKVINPIITGNLEEILKKIGSALILLPRIEYIEKSSQKTIPISYQITNLIATSENGHLLKGGTDGKTAWTMKVYSIHQGMISELYLSRIFGNLKEKGLNEKNLLDYFCKTGIFPESSLEIISIGINRYFSEDYVSSLHILIPQFENVFLYVSERAGIDIISLNRTREISTQLKTLSSEYLSSTVFQEKWGRDLCEQIKFVLFDPLGYTLRHKIAHGQINKQECTLSNTNLIMYLFLVLCSRVGVNK